MQLETLSNFARAWIPGPSTVNARERLRAAAGAAAGLFFTALVCLWIVGPSPSGSWLIPPLGASAVLVFALPASPLAQPWPVIGGNTLSALVGVACVHWVPDGPWVGALATALAISLMFALRCLHPPGGAMALLPVLMHTAPPFEFALFPAMASSLLLVLAGVLYNSATGRRYPHVQIAPKPSPGDGRFSPADIDAVLARYNQVLDISRDDLESLIRQTEVESWHRRLGTVRCADVMSRDPLFAEFGTSLEEVWSLMHERHIKALPVVDRARRMIGIITQADFFRHIDLRHHAGLGGRLRDFIRATRTVMSNKPEVAGQIMTQQVRVASEDRPLAELVPLFSEGGHHHIPIIDAEGRLVGMVTQSDFVRALYRAVGPEA
jgi:CBS domain-containing membrane protein